MSEVVLDPKAQIAFDAIKAGTPIVYIAGKAGVGKTFLINLIRESISARRKMVVIAPTGVAALNIQGQTIHSFFRLPARMLTSRELPTHKKGPVSAVELIIIDEISMVRSDMLDNIDTILRRSRNRSKPFGGVQMVFVGDCYQLSPVVSNDQAEVFYKLYESPWFFDAKVFRMHKMFCVELTHIYRQTDKRFIKALHNIRTNTDVLKTAGAINSLCYGTNDIDDERITLCTTNNDADTINMMKLNDIDSPEVPYEGMVTGDFGLIGGNLPVQKFLMLKVGARVMLKKNMPETTGAVNGALGTILNLHSSQIKVELDSGSIITVEENVWTNHKYDTKTIDGQTEIVSEPVGTYTQFPLILGYAITVHKCQGLTLDKVRLSLGRIFASGQLYVALSRCRTLEGISLTRRLRAEDVELDPRVVAFYRDTFVDCKQTASKMSADVKAVQDKIANALGRNNDDEPITGDE